MIKHNYIPLEVHSLLAANISAAIAAEIGLSSRDIAVAWWLGLLHDAGWILVRPEWDSRERNYKFRHEVGRYGVPLIELFLETLGRIVAEPFSERFKNFIEATGLDVKDIMLLVDLHFKGSGEMGDKLAEHGFQREVAYAVLNGDAIASTIEEREVSGHLRGIWSTRYFELVRYFSTTLIQRARPYGRVYERIVLHVKVLDKFMGLLDELCRESFSGIAGFGVSFSPLIEVTLEGVCYVLPARVDCDLRRRIEDWMKGNFYEILKGAPKDFPYTLSDCIEAVMGRWTPKNRAGIGCLFCGSTSVRSKFSMIFPEFGKKPTYKSTFVYSDKKRALEGHVTPCPSCAISFLNWGRLRERRKRPARLLTYIPVYYDITLRRERVEGYLKEWKRVAESLVQMFDPLDVARAMEESSEIARRGMKPPQQSALLVADVATKNTSYKILKSTYEMTANAVGDAATEYIYRGSFACMFEFTWDDLCRLCDILSGLEHFSPLVVNSWKYVHGVDVACIGGEVFFGRKLALGALEITALTMKYCAKDGEFKAKVQQCVDMSDLLRLFDESRVGAYNLTRACQLAKIPILHDNFSSIMRAITFMGG